jgi:hypothetical protein
LLYRAALLGLEPPHQLPSELSSVPILHVFAG